MLKKNIITQMIFRTFYSIFIASVLDGLHIRRKPKVIQMPITSRCNSMCKTCNIWGLKGKVDMDPIRLKAVLSDNYFSEVRDVGINGGEITLVENWKEILEAVLSLRKIRGVHIISNGLKKDKLLEILSEAKKLCSEKKVRLGFTLSVDGIGKVHDTIRGIPKAYERSQFLLEEISRNKEKYCDVFIIGCTISRFNIPYMREIEMELNKYGQPIEFHLAVPNKRIHTFENANSYNVLDDEWSRLLATEYFYRKSKEATNLGSKIKYHSVFYYLKRGGKGRLCNCGYLYRDVTIDESLNLYLCATASDKAGSLIGHTLSQYVKDGKLKKLAQENKKYCDQCIHYSSTPTLKGIFLFVKHNLQEKYEWHNKFKNLVKWQKLLF